MLRRSVSTSACALVVSLGLLGAGAATGAVTGTVDDDAAAATGDPLRVFIEEMQPSVVTGDRPVRIRGTVTNTSDETWTEINLAPFRSAFPITDSATLNAAAALADDAYVGDRLTDVEALAKVDSLAPGASASFTTTIPRARLGRSPGVYWVGVHASGVTESQPRDEFTDGRARTFLPVAERASAPLPTALVLPVRAPVHHTPDGRVDRTEDWAEMLSSGGLLEAALDVAETTSGRPVTWLVDPAVPHTVARLAAGNPAWTLEPVDSEPTASAEPADELAPDETTAPVLPSPEPGPRARGGNVPDFLVEAAQAWLERFTATMADAEVLALPYGDVDASAVAASRPALLAGAHVRSAQVLEALGVESTPVVTSPDGHLSRAAVETTPSEALVLLGENGLTDDEGPAPTTGTVLGHDFAATSAGIAAGGPGPESPGTPVAVRQRVVSEAVLRDLADDLSPLVVAPPEAWDAGTGAADLLEALDSPRFRLRSLPDLVRSTPGRTLGARSLVHTEAQRAAEVPADQVRAAAQWVARARLLESVLRDPAGFDAQVRDLAWPELSHHTRRRSAAALDRIRAGRAEVDALLSSITITGPLAATLSGETGTIGTTVTNGLGVPVTVNVEVDSSADLAVEVPNPIAIPPDSRRRLLLQTTAGREGVQSLTLRVADAEGRPLGGEATVQVRASEVGGLLWLIMGTGAVVLFGAIAVRLFRRGLARRATQGFEPTLAPEPDPEGGEA